ncbi:hypothetical protein ACLK19_04280 [Escherichia coli]
MTTGYLWVRVASEIASGCGVALVVLYSKLEEVTYAGRDLGAAIKGFKKAMNDDDAAAKNRQNI